MSHLLLGLIPLGIIFAAAISVLFPGDGSRRSGPENGWMNAQYLEQEDKRTKRNRDLRRRGETAGNLEKDEGEGGS